MRNTCGIQSNTSRVILNHTSDGTLWFGGCVTLALFSFLQPRSKARGPISHPKAACASEYL